MEKLSAPFIGIDRHRLFTDGEGVTTLVAFYGCPLRCRYCINPQSWSSSFEPEWLTPKQLYNRTRIDELYFLATGGGITFGGGEPCLYPEFITQFRDIVGPGWKIYLETSLNVDPEKFRIVEPSVDRFIIDIKDMNPDIYRSYTGHGNEHVLSNLHYLASLNRQSDCVVRLPLIRDYNTREDITKSKEELAGLGFDKTDVFKYLVKE
ncbi:MAG: radical SAM protein [Muribaculaceae bacterium]|nr:radical SAM protein [Muribaculaceae bacterium]